jgi:NADP-dependent 3-hydroxy acid dehydrogenase YdfG
MKQLAGKTALVTGGASGIGLAISRALVDAGMNVVIADIQRDALDSALDQFNQHASLMTLELDVANAAAWQQAVEKIEARFGNIHLLINNAGVVVSGAVAEATLDDWNWVIDVNLRGVVNGIVNVLPRMLSHGEGGHIVNTASTSGLLPHAGAVIYTTTKSAVIGMSEAMRSELEAQGIIVSVLCPGPVVSHISQSGRNRQAHYAESGYTVPEPTPIRQQQQVADYLMSAEDVAAIVLEGIERDDLYIMTHPEFAEGLAERAAAQASALPRRPHNEVLKATMARVMTNPAFTDEINRRQQARSPEQEKDER